MNKATGVGCAGAVLIHPVLAVLLMVCGAIFGSSGPNFGATGSDGGSTAYGLAGAFNAMELLLVLYVFTFGIAPIVVTIVGFVLSWLVMEGLSRRPWDPKTKKTVQVVSVSAVVIHPLLFLLSFLGGIVVYYDPGRAGSGVAGGVTWMGRLARSYLDSPGAFFIATVMISLVGVGLGWLGIALRSMFVRGKLNGRFDRPDSVNCFRRMSD